MLKSCKQHGVRYDPRIKLLQVLLVGILVFVLTGKKYEISLFLSVFTFAMLSGLFKTGIKLLVIYIGLFLAAEISPLFIATTIHYFVLCFITIAFVALNLAKTTDISEILAALHNMKIPYWSDTIKVQC